jgi:hypothetical protein
MRVVPVGGALALSVFGLAASPALALDQKQQLREARGSYYNLPAQGFSRMQCQVTPNWDVMLPKNLEPARRKGAIDRLNLLRSSVAIDAAGAAKFEHGDTGPAPTAQEASGFAQVAAGLDETLSGFIGTWTAFMLTSPLPSPDSDHLLAEDPAGYRLTYKDGDATIVTTLDRDFVIKATTVGSSAFSSTITPTLRRETGGWVLAGYVGDYRPTAGPGVTHLVISIDYQTVDGLRIPRVVKLDGDYDSQPVSSELTFSACRVTRR